MFPAVPPTDSVGRARRRESIDGFGPVATVVITTVWIVVSVAVLVVAVVVGTREMAQYLRLGALDDYRDGYQMGSEWTHRGASDCQEVMTTRYGDPWEDHGWNAFVVGCRDAVEGRDAATWYSLRGRLAETTASD